MSGRRKELNGECPSLGPDSPLKANPAASPLVFEEAKTSKPSAGSTHVPGRSRERDGRAKERRTLARRPRENRKMFGNFARGREGRRKTNKTGFVDATKEV